ncbi:hypothetical protein [Luteibacter sp. 329MFSha]|uniref:hypothetical protein n=1 Tax=Luteibacter sp. 329MFSha TaxID=1798239 RepID=UPI0008D781FB|nr:hypothetical protein [Luteibacter sp. 329MFSha]SEW27887.1 hypothetical protein SAMN04515660_3561 [Luteibacter sp. 329MFSha]
MDKNVVLLIAGTILVLFVKAVLSRQRRPKNAFFSCGRCRKTTRHDNRTIRAWQAGKDRYFCATCHRAWLATRPAHEAPRSPSGPRPSQAAPHPDDAPLSRGAATRRTDEAPRRDAAEANTRPPPVYRGSPRGSKGCLGMVILIIGLPIGIALACLHYATSS